MVAAPNHRRKSAVNSCDFWDKTCGSVATAAEDSLPDYGGSPARRFLAIGFFEIKSARLRFI
jgi:hypothetical protein